MDQIGSEGGRWLTGGPAQLNQGPANPRSEPAKGHGRGTPPSRHSFYPKIDSRKVLVIHVANMASLSNS